MDIRFVKYLIAYGVGLILIWLVFALFVIPLLPVSIAGPLALLGIFAGMVLLSLVIIYKYDQQPRDGDHE